MKIKMKKLDYDKFLNANKMLGVFCKTPEEIEEFAKQMDIRGKRASLNLPYKSIADFYNTTTKGMVFLNTGNFGALDVWDGKIDIYDFTTGQLINWKRGTKRPNDYCYHKDVIDYKDYVFENQLYRISYYRNEPQLRTKFVDIKQEVIGYIDNFNPADKIAIRDKNNLLYCIDYKLITLIEPIRRTKK